MLDARTLPEISPVWTSLAQGYQGVTFVWKRWENPGDPSGHEHCLMCWACICNHRELFPHKKEEHAKRGCYRHAFHGERAHGIRTWICRSCFKRVAPEAGLIRGRRLNRVDAA
jgi:hypothetical protein